MSRYFELHKDDESYFEVDQERGKAIRIDEGTVKAFLKRFDSDTYWNLFGQ